MKLVRTIDELNELRDKSTKKVALVPTMGALHEGHLSLVKLAQEHAEEIWVSIFVNPLQFGVNEDLDKYPRTLEADMEKLKSLNVDYIFAPEANEIYKEKPETIKANPDIANKLCGLSRPGHFDGVCTVVKRLFDLVKPDIAVFGEKDYQQLQVIRAMVEEYDMPVKIVPAPIVREANGLAMSSRNQYLTGEQKELASSIYRELCSPGAHSFPEGIEVEYLEEHWGRVFIAAKIGGVRLIDNLVYARSSTS